MILRLITVGLALMCAYAHAAEKPMRIVCVGDSITQGRQGKGEHKPTQSYRYALWKALIDAKHPADFVGSMTTGFEGSPVYEPYMGSEFPNRHEGRWGWTTEKVAEALQTSVASKTWQADLAIIMLGTNDKDTKTNLTPTVAAMRAIVGSLRLNNPQMRIVIGQPFQEWEPFPAMGAAYAALAKELTTAESPIISTVTSTGWVSKPDLAGATTVDWVHPNQIGDAKLAAAFAAAIKPWLESTTK